jgi:hypothetical protein
MAYPGSPINRTAIKNYLLNLVQNVTFQSPINNFSTWASPVTRRLKLWNNVDSSLQPAAFLVQHREGYQRYGVGLVRRYLDMGIWCYAPTGTDSTLGDDYLDWMETALEEALAPDDPTRNELTLDGLVYWCRIMREEGLFIRDPGDIDGQALLVLPIRILLP